MEHSNHIDKSVKELANLQIQEPNFINGDSYDLQDNIRDALQHNLDGRATELLEQEVDTESYKRIKDLFKKTEKMRELAKEKNKEVEDQFQSLKERLSTSTAFLHQMKTTIENLKFSYQKKVMELNNKLGDAEENQNKQFKSKEDMDIYMEEIRNKIDKLQSKLATHKENHSAVTLNYQSAFEDVVNNLQKIESGMYSSQMQKKDEN